MPRIKGILETSWRDLLYALRTLRKDPFFAATAVALAGRYLPARRAVRIDPITALRVD